MKNVFLLFVILGMVSCNTYDHVTFGTKTSLSILDMDATPGVGGVSAISLDRVEASVGPTNQDGTAASAFAFSDVDGSIINPQGQQIYATGIASECLLHSDTSVLDSQCWNISNIEEASDRVAFEDGSITFPYEDTMIFGTSTTTGFKLGINNNLPSILAGYRRRELSIIPLQNNGGKDIYPSVLATITMGIDVADQAQPGLDAAQVYATGNAAKLLARLLGDRVRNRVLSSHGGNP